jgi:hypothetical protein
MINYSLPSSKKLTTVQYSWENDFHLYILESKSDNVSFENE